MVIVITIIITFQKSLEATQVIMVGACPRWCRGWMWSILLQVLQGMTSLVEISQWQTMRAMGIVWTSFLSDPSTAPGGPLVRRVLLRDAAEWVGC